MLNNLNSERIMTLEDWKSSNEYSHYQSLIKQDNENRKTIKRLIEEIRDIKRKQASEATAISPLVRQSVFGVYPDSVGFDLADENKLMAVFRTEEQANKFGRMMWGSMYYVEPIDSPHFALHILRLKAQKPIGKTDIYNVLAIWCGI